MKSAVLSLLLSSSCAAFSPSSFGESATTLSRGRKTLALHVSVVRDILESQKGSGPSTNGKSNDHLVWEMFETETPESVGVMGPGILSSSHSQHQIQESLSKTSSKRKTSNRRRRKHNYQEQRSHLQEEPDLDFLTLHSSAVSHLQRDTPVNDIVRAMKRAQNLHDVHDLATIGAFLMDHCDEHWGFGYRGSLLSRLAVAALHCGETEIAFRAIETRRKCERPSMQPHESAAIVRGLMRMGQLEEGWEVLNDELRLPMEGVSLALESSQDLLKHRARALASIASRHFYEGEPYVAALALNHLGALGSIYAESPLAVEDLEVPWDKLVTAATVCADIVSKNGWDVKHINGWDVKHMDVRMTLVNPDLAELVWNAMVQFPCPGNEEECSLEDYIAAAP